MGSTALDWHVNLIFAFQEKRLKELESQAKVEYRPDRQARRNQSEFELLVDEEAKDENRLNRVARRDQSEFELSDDEEAKVDYRLKKRAPPSPREFDPKEEYLQNQR